MYNYNYGYDYATANGSVGSIVWIILSVIFAIIGGILVYLLFVKSNKPSKGNITKFKNFLSFKTMLIEPILKVCYLISTIFIILFSFTFISSSVLSFILILILGPIIIRLFYEGTLLILMIWKNTSEINAHFNSNNIEVKEKKEVK